MSSPERKSGPERICVVAAHKTAHPNRQDADRAARAMNEHYRGRQVARPYRCPCGCGGFYVTHKGRRLRRRAERERHQQQHRY